MSNTVMGIYDWVLTLYVDNIKEEHLRRNHYGSLCFFVVAFVISGQSNSVHKQ